MEIEDAIKHLEQIRDYMRRESSSSGSLSSQVEALEDSSDEIARALDDLAGALAGESIPDDSPLLWIDSLDKPIRTQ